jgi:CBS domain-containing protein
MLIDDSLEVLSEEECRSLLEQATVGRVGVSVEALPAILPVNYSMVDGAIIFRTGEGTKLRAALSHTIVAFEVDHTDPGREEGWDVLVVGLAEPVDAVGETPGSGVMPEPWAGGRREHLVRIRPEMISGRRVAHPARPLPDERAGSLRAADAARRAVTVSRTASLRQVEALLAADPAGAAVVEDPGMPIEVVSLREVAAAIGAGADPATSTVADLALVRRPYLAGGTGVSEALDRLIASGTGEALVLDEDGLVGLATMATLCPPHGRRPAYFAAGRREPGALSQPDGQPGIVDLEPDMEIWVNRRPVATTVSVLGRLDLRTAGAVAQVLNDLTKNSPEEIHLDLRRVDQQSPVAIGALRQLLVVPSGRSIHFVGFEPTGPAGWHEHGAPQPASR